MNMDKLIELGTCPIAFPEWKIGLVIQWDINRDEIGVQFPNEDNIQWVPATDVTDSGFGALIVPKPLATLHNDSVSKDTMEGGMKEIPSHN